MNTHQLINEQSIAEASKPSPKLRKRQRALCAFLAITAIVVLAGCAGHGYSGSSYGSPGYRSGGYYGYPGSYRSGGYYGGGVHRGRSYGIQHGFGRSGFGGGRFGHGGGLRH